MADKYLKINTSGNIQEVEATASSAGAGDAGEIVALDAGGKISSTMMPAGVGSDSQTVEAGETLSVGDLVNLYDDSGVKMRKADASDATKPCHGFVLDNVTSGANGTCYFEGTITGLTSITPGAKQFLSASTPGATDETPPSGSGNIVQAVGAGSSSTTVTFETSLDFVVRA